MVLFLTFTPCQCANIRICTSNYHNQRTKTLISFKEPELYCQKMPTTGAFQHSNRFNVADVQLSMGVSLLHFSPTVGKKLQVRVTQNFLRTKLRAKLQNPVRLWDVL